MRRIRLIFLFLFALLPGMNAWAVAVERPVLCSFSMSGAQECLPGEYLENKNESIAPCNCVPCPEGTYSTKANVTACTACTTTPCDPTTGEPLEPEFNDYKFTATIDLSLYDDNIMGSETVTEFGFNLGASGTFYVDWGDGTTETIKKDNTDAVTYTHDYGTTSGTYTVKIGGLATDYSDDEDTPAISFGVEIAGMSAYSQAITEISGSLGAIFPTLSDGSQPRFPNLFYRAIITAIPSGLFDGIHGAPVSNMFADAFGGCYNLTSIPENLFAGITGNAPYMFYYTFSDCYNLTSIPENLFSGITGAAEGMFAGTFFACYSLADIPETLFAGITGNAPDMFSSTFAVCEGLTSIPENLFSGITGAADGMFTSTFMGCTGITNIPEKLFAGVTGSAPYLFNGTFDFCSSLTSIPENLFSGITGAADGMFEYTFQGCYMLTGPSARINGKPLYELWPDNVADWGNSMYYDSTGLDDYACIPTVMGGGGEECAAEPEFDDYKFTATIDLSLYDDLEPVTEFGFDLGAAGTFYVDWGDGTTETIKKDNTDAVPYTHDYGTTSGTYTVKIGGLATDYSDDEHTPAISFGVGVGLSSVYSQAITEISGSLGAIFPTLSDGSQPRFPNLFDMANITAIPSGLFDGIHGAPVSNMFAVAFGGCYITSIPENLFAGITGNAPYMFSGTFSDCSNLTSIPENLFSGITGAAEGMFAGTFTSCYSLADIPETLFAGITGNAPDMFSYTFNTCSNLTSIPENLFSGITGAADRMFAGTFYSCDSLTGPSARINGKPLYELWPDNIAGWGDSMYDGATGLDDYACIPTVMGGGGETCEPAPEYKFSIIADTSSFSFKISAAGTFYVDWGDGTTEIIKKTDTAQTSYSHSFSTKGAYTIKIGGLATAYNSSRSTASISFASSGGDLKVIEGSLGAIFPTLTNGEQPSFDNAFANCFRLTSIPENLFSGITGAAEGMFRSTFSDSSITSIPENLFSGITGNAPNMFSDTFAMCLSLTSIPEKLFSGITGAAEGMFSGTFTYSGITSIPENLFSGITGNAPVMFAGTFSDCYGLTSIPENLFSGITGAAEGMFGSTFAYCSNLTGPSARINGKYLYELWDEDPQMWGRNMYANATGLDDYAYIPVIMGGLGQSREQLCTIGISQIKTSTGLAFALYAEKYTQPSMAIKYNNGICYGKLEQGNQSGTMNFNYNGVVYHLIN